MNSQLKKQITNATKWSSITEILAKLIVPITNMALARILAPSVFGIIATVNMVISFCDMFTTAGFQRYLIQHDYKSKEELYQGTSVAFWTNLGLSIFLWGALVVFRDPIASFVGSEGYGLPIAVAGFSLPLTSLSSIQIALYRRNLDFKTLFTNRLVSTLIPFIITIPLALVGAGYWSLIIGTISGYLAQGIILTIKSDWKPKWFYSYSLLKEMLSFSIWTLFESIALWATGWIDIFIISNHLGSYYTGLYRIGQSTVTGILSIISSATTAVLFSSLSRVQHDGKQFSSVLFSFQKSVALLVVPLGVGIYMFKDVITTMLLGANWMDASEFIGIWGLCTSLVVTYGTLSREAYRAKGRPKVSLIVQLLHLAFIIPACIYGVRKGFDSLIYIRSIASLQIILLHMIFMKAMLKFDVLKMLKTSFPVICASTIMGGVAYIFRTFFSNINVIVIIVLSCIVYSSVIIMFPSYRKIVTALFSDIKNKLFKRT